MHNCSTLRWLHHREDLRETLSIARNSLTWLPERQSLPNMVVDGLAEQIDYALFAACAVGGTDILLREHGALFFRSLVLHADKHVVQALDIFLQCCEFLFEGLLVREHAPQLVEHVLQSLHHAGLKLLQVSLGCLLRQLVLNLGLVLGVSTLVVVEVFAELGDCSFQVFKQTGSNAAVTATDATTAAAPGHLLDLVVEEGKLLVERVDLGLVIVD